MRRLQRESRRQTEQGMFPRKQDVLRTRFFLMAMATSIFRGVLLQQMSTWLFSYTENKITKPPTCQTLESPSSKVYLCCNLKHLKYLSRTWQTSLKEKFDISGNELLHFLADGKTGRSIPLSYLNAKYEAYQNLNKWDITCQLVSLRGTDGWFLIYPGQSQASCFPLFVVFVLS